MVRFLGLLVFVASAGLLASFLGSSGLLGVVLLAVLVGVFAIIVTLLNEIRRVMH